MGLIERDDDQTEVARRFREAANAGDPWAAAVLATVERDEAREQLRGAVEDNEELKRRLVAEMCLTRTRTEMLEEFGPDYEQYLEGQ